jgi:uncharacterized protein (DUF2141 family)
MKTTLLFAWTFLFMSISVFAQQTLRVEVTNLKSTVGVIQVGLFDNEKNFLKKAFAGQTIAAQGTRVEVVFNNIPDGDYAISVIHDENENGELDSNFLGIPNEGFGFGNDAMGTFGPPSFDKAKVKVDGKNQKQVIALRYL